MNNEVKLEPMKQIIVILSLFFTLFSFTPSLFEIIQSPKILSDRVFVLEHNYMFDYNFYLSRIREGGEGRWTVVEKYYNLPHDGSLFQIFYLWAGKAGGLLGVAPPVVYHALRIISGSTLLLLTGFYAYRLFPNWWGITAFITIITSGSWPILTKAGEFYRFSTHMGNWSAIDSLQRITFLPHVLAGQIFILLFIWKFGGDYSSHSLKLLIWGIVGLIAGIIFPPTLIVVYVYFVVLSMIEIFAKFPKSLKSLRACFKRPQNQRHSGKWNASRIPMRSWMHFVYQDDVETKPLFKQALREWMRDIGLSRVIFFVISLPVLLYAQYMFQIWPWKALALFDILHRMPLPYQEYFLALGPVLPLGLAGLIVALIKREKKLFGVLSWVLSVFLLFAVFEKVPTQSPLRFTEALIHIPLGILTIYLFQTLFYSLHKFSLERKFVQLLRISIVMTMIIINLLGLSVMVSMVGWLTDQAKAKKDSTWLVPIGAQLSYPLKDFMDGIYYLRDNTKQEEVILSYITAGNYIPAYAGNFVYIGHANTPDEDGKEKIAARFFSGKMSYEEAKEFLAKEKISYIFFGPQERELGNVNDLSSIYPFVISDYNNEKVIIYQFRKAIPIQDWSGGH